MDNIQETLDRLSSKSISAGELKRCLGSGNILIRSNTILAIVRLGVIDEDVLHELSRIAKNIKGESRVFGLWNCGHFAMAALKQLGTKCSLDKYAEILPSLSAPQREDVDRLLSNWPG